MSPVGEVPTGRGSADRIRALLDRREELTSAFQPILSLREARVLGFEALLRLPAGSGFADPGEAFQAAAETPWLVELEITALDRHLEAARGLPEGRLFLNLSAPAFLDERLQAASLARRSLEAGFPPERVVLELTELVRIPDPVRFADALRPFREAGFHLAVDDFGVGFTNMQMLVELGPDFVKVDRSLVAGASQHPRKRVFLESLGVLGRRINCAVIAEGAETGSDLATLRACGVPYAQGAVIASPAPLSILLGSIPLPAPAPLLSVPPEEPAGAFAVPQDGVPPDARVGSVMRLFEARPEPVAIPVLKGGRALGLVTRGLLFFHLGHRYGFALWHDRTVADFIAVHGTAPDRIPAFATLEDTAEFVRRRPTSRRFDPIVVETERGDYHGLLPVDVILSEMTRLKVEYALQSNPLTGLPGSVMLARATEARLLAGRAFTLGWIDIDHFKPFNDRYGFGRGDEVLQLLAQLLRGHFGQDPGDFLAHPGGDDFAFLTSPLEDEARARAVAEEFSARVGALYDEADRRAGEILSVDRQGVTRRFGFLAVSIGLVTWNGESGADYRRLVEVAAEVKAVAKRTSGPAVIKNARALVRD